MVVLCMWGRFRYFDGCSGGDDDDGGGPFAGVRNFCTARPIERPLRMLAMATTTQAHSAASARVATVFRGWLQIPPGNIKEVKALCWP